MDFKFKINDKIFYVEKNQILCDHVISRSSVETAYGIRRYYGTQHTVVNAENAFDNEYEARKSLKK